MRPADDATSDRVSATYPPRAVDWLVPDGPGEVLELGAGTGRLTRALEDAGHRLTATEPSAYLLDHLVRHTRATVVQAEPEHLPFRAARFDAVVVGHGVDPVDPPRALREIARVLRDGGVLATASTVRDDSLPWVRRLTEILGPPGPGAASGLAEAAARGDLFGEPDLLDVGFWERLGRDDLLSMARSHPSVADLDRAARDTLLDRVAALHDEHARSDGLRMRHTCRCRRWRVDRSALPPDTADRADGSRLFGFGLR